MKWLPQETDAQQLGFHFAESTARASRPRLQPRVRVELVREAEPSEIITLRGASDIYALLQEEVATWDRERFVTLLLDNKHHLIGIEEVSVGSLTSTIVHPREVFKAIILSNAAAFIVAHSLCAATHKFRPPDLRRPRTVRFGRL
jgi:DNA repair protein RadC